MGLEQPPEATPLQALPLGSLLEEAWPVQEAGENVLQCLGGVSRGGCAPAGWLGALAGSSASCGGLVLPGAHTLLLINSLFNTTYIFLPLQHFLTLLPLGLEQEFSVAERGCMCVFSEHLKEYKGLA